MLHLRIIIIKILSGTRQFATGDRHHLKLLQRATPNQFCVLNTSIRGAVVDPITVLFIGNPRVDHVVSPWWNIHLGEHPLVEHPLGGTSAVTIT